MTAALPKQEYKTRTVADAGYAVEQSVASKRASMTGAGLVLAANSAIRCRKQNEHSCSYILCALGHLYRVFCTALS